MILSLNGIMFMIFVVFTLTPTKPDVELARLASGACTVAAVFIITETIFIVVKGL